MLNSCLGLFSATGSRRHPFSRTYGVNLPSSLATLLPLVLGSSPRLPVSVCGTGASYLDSGFSRQCGFRCFGTRFSLRVTPSNHHASFTTWLSTALAPAISAARSAPPPASPLLYCDNRQYRILYLLSITYAFRPRLRSRLTLGGRTFPRKP